VEYLCKITRNFPKLKELELLFAGFPIKGEGLERLGHEISLEIRHLEYLRLYFEAYFLSNFSNGKTLGRI